MVLTITQKHQVLIYILCSTITTMAGRHSHPSTGRALERAEVLQRPKLPGMKVAEQPVQEVAPVAEPRQLSISIEYCSM